MITLDSAYVECVGCVGVCVCVCGGGGVCVCICLFLLCNILFIMCVFLESNKNNYFVAVDVIEARI